MGSNTTDRRVKYTKSVLKQSLLDIMQRKPLRKITTTELCREADISRNTFYTHYRDPQDLYQQLLEEFSDELTTSTEAVESYVDFYSIVLPICNVVLKEPKLAKMYLENASSDKFVGKVLERVKNASIPYYRKKGFNGTDADIDMLFGYMTNGTIYLLRSWIENDFKDTPEEVANKIDKINSNVLMTYTGLYS